jgi:hypothetical protein
MASDKINHSKFLLFADILNIYRDTKSVEDCKALQADNNSAQLCCVENCMKLKIQKIKL